MVSVKEMILIEGLKFDLDLEWSEDGIDSIPICTTENNKVVVLGEMKLIESNFLKIKMYSWKYLEYESEVGWQKKEFNWFRVPRPKLEVLNYVYLEGEEEDFNDELFKDF